jgi:hypothetical protein
MDVHHSRITHGHRSSSVFFAHSPDLARQLSSWLQLPGTRVPRSSSSCRPRHPASWSGGVRPARLKWEFGFGKSPTHSFLIQKAEPCAAFVYREWVAAGASICILRCPKCPGQDRHPRLLLRWRSPRKPTLMASRATASLQNVVTAWKASISPGPKLEKRLIPSLPMTQKIR